MKIIFSRWVDTLVLAVGVSWEDWHIRQFRIWLDLFVISISFHFRFRNGMKYKCPEDCVYNRGDQGCSSEDVDFLFDDDDEFDDNATTICPAYKAVNSKSKP